MKEQFTTHEISVKLRELGFDEPCFAGWNSANEEIFGNSETNNPLYFINNRNRLVSRPLWQQVIDWFREEYNLLIDSPNLDIWNDGKWSVKVTSLDKKIILEEFVDQPYWIFYRCFKSYQEAREQSILKVIELIRNRKNEGIKN